MSNKNQILVIPQSTGGGGGGAVDSVNGKTGDVVLVKSDLGLGNVDNTSDLNKPISTATQTALDGKQDESVQVITPSTVPAQNDQFYHVTDIVIFNDPTGVEGKGYTVEIIDGGTATVGGTQYIMPGIIINRRYDGGVWKSYVYQTTPEQVGVVINETWNNLSNWATTGAGWGVSGNLLTIPNGANNFTGFLISNTSYGATKTRNHSYTLSNYVIPTINGTSYGISIGYESISLGPKRDIQFRFCTDTTNQGYIQVYHNRTLTVIKTSSNRLAITAGQSTDCSVVRIKDVFIVTWKNNATGLSVTLPYKVESIDTLIAPNFSRFAIYAHGGATTAGSYIGAITEIKNADIACLGDSLTVPIFSGNSEQGWTNILSDMMNANVITLAGSGDRLEDFNTTEILALKPRFIFILCGTNNKGAGESDATIVTKMQALVASLTGYTYGTNLFISRLLPSNTYDTTTTNTALSTPYPNMVDMNTSFLNPAGGTGIDPAVSSDGLHIITEKQFDLADILFQYFVKNTNLIQRTNPRPYRNVPYLSGSKLPVGPVPFRPLCDLEVINPIAGYASMRIGYQVGIESGGWLHSTTTNNLYSGVGIAYDGTNWIAKNANYCLFVSNNGNLDFVTATGATVGNVQGITTLNSFTKGRVNSNGKWAIYSQGQGFDIIELSTLATRGLRMSQYSNSVNGNIINIYKTRSTTVSGGNAAVVSGDDLLNINIGGADGTSQFASAVIKAVVSGAVSTGVIPVDVVFFVGSTSSPSEQLRLLATGGIQLSNNLIINTVGNGIRIKEGANARMGTGTLVGGTLTISNTTITANTRIFLTATESGTLTSPLRVTARVVGTSFTVGTSSPTDTASFNWELKEGI